MSEPIPYETRTRVGGTESKRSEVLDSVVSFTQAAGGPAAGAYVLGQAIKTTGEVLVAKINAGVEKMKPGGQPNGPTHDEFG